MNSKELERKILESSIVSASAEQISSDLGGEVVILNLKTGIYHGLNEVAAQVWTLIQEPKTVFDINPVLSLSENNNRSETLEPLSNQTLSLSFLIETKIYSQKLKSKAPKGFQGLAFPNLT